MVERGSDKDAFVISPVADDIQDRRISFSVDADGLADYLNFAPKGTQIDSDPITYPVLITRLLELFERHRIKATFFCIGRALRAEATQLMRQAVAAGHAIANHTLSHHEMSTLDEQTVRAEVAEGHRAILESIGYAPVGFRGPAYFISPEILDELGRLHYRYDSSACPAPLMRKAQQLLGLVRFNYRPKPGAPLQRRFADDHDAVLKQTDSEMMEFPIPVAYGLPFYGTFHAFLPSSVFFIQLGRLAQRPHIHYELHPIEIVDAAIAQAYPWLPTAKAARKRDLAVWLDQRLTALKQGRRVITLEEISATHLCHHS